MEIQDDDGQFDVEDGSTMGGTSPDGSFVPSWASKTIHALQKRIQRKEQRLERRSQKIDDCKERIDIMAEHLRNVQFELIKTQELLDAKAKAIESEDHMKRLAEQELSRIRSDIIHAERDTQQSNEKTHAVQNELFAANEKIERFRTQQNWNQEELEQWVLAMKQNDEDSTALAQYRRQDDARIKAASMTIEQLTKEAFQLKRGLDQEVTETVSAQIELDRMAVDFRDVHLERQEIVAQWEQAQSLLVQRDGDICRAALEVQKVKEDIRETRSQNNHVNNILDQERANNQSIELDIKSAERSAEKTRVCLQEQHRLRQIEIEEEMRKRDLQESLSFLHQTQQGLSNDRQMQINKMARLKACEHKLKMAEERLKMELEKAGDISNQSQQVQKMYDESVERNGACEKQLHGLMQAIFKSNQELFEIRKMESNTMAMISGAQVTLRNVQSQILELDQRSIGQQEMLYGIEFQLQQIERKVVRASGKRSFNEKIELNLKITKLTAELDQQMQQEKSMMNHVKEIVITVDKCQKRLVLKIGELSNLNESLNEHLLQNQSAERQLAICQNQKDDLILKCDVLRFESQQLRDNLLKHLDQVYFLENRKNQLKLEIQEREKKLEMEENIVRAELRLEEERRHKLALEVREREQKIEALHNKYEVIAGKLRGSDGEEQHSQAYYIIQAAQQKEELIRAGDALNRAIKIEEQNLKRLDIARRDLKINNSKYRESIQKSDPKGAEASLKNDLLDKKKLYEGVLTKKKLTLRELQDDCDERNRLIQEMEDDIHHVHEEASAQSRHYLSLTETIDTTQTKSQATLAKIRDISASDGRTEGEIRNVMGFMKQSTHDLIRNALEGGMTPSFKLISSS